MLTLKKNYFKKTNSENESVISLENNALLNKALSLDSENKSYIDSIIDSYIIEKGSTLKSYDTMMSEAVISLIAMILLLGLEIIIVLQSRLWD